MTTNRRRFLKQSATVVGLSLPGDRVVRAAPTGNRRVRIGVIGTGVRGKYLIGNLPATASVVAICDCALDRMEDTLNPKREFKQVLAQFRDTDASRCATYQDYRRMLDREQLDAVVIATPDHHHAQAAVLAMDVGLHVYLEKPLAVTINEGRLLVDKAKRSGIVFQVGSQQRTMEINRFACEFIRDGGLGAISKVRLPNYPGPIQQPSLGKETTPSGIDWDLFLGPTPVRDYHRRLWVKDEFKVGDLLWRGWDLFRDYSGHLMTNWGAHSIDMVQYALGKDETGPVSIRTREPAADTPFAAQWAEKTPPPTDRTERRFWPIEMKYADGIDVQFAGADKSIYFHGERGVLKMSRNFFTVDPPDLVVNRPAAEVADRWKGSGHVAAPHLQNWLECIKSRELPNAPVEVGHRTATICHLANIAREVNRPLNWNPDAERFVNDPDANRLLSRPRRTGFELQA